MSAPPVQLRPADQIDAAALHAAFVAAFSDYVAGPFKLAPAQWPGFLTRQGADLALSRAAVDADSGAVLAFALVAPRPALSRWRLATMGALPAARGSGAAGALLQDFVQRGQAAGLRAVELEVFAQNERALRLYRRHGFVERHALRGYLREPGAMAPAAGSVLPLLVAQSEALAWLQSSEREIDDFPLQVSAPIVQALPVPWTCWRHGTAQLVFSGDDRQGLLLRSLVDRDPAQADAQALLSTLCATYPGARIHMPALQREDLGGLALARCGFVEEALHQWLMRRALR